MNDERIETSLRFVGDWPWWVGVTLALLAGGAAWWLYRREIRRLAWWLGLVLPGLRALAVIMVVLMLAGPVLHHRKTIGQLAKLWLFADGSKSMELTDPSLDLGRKIMLAVRLGLLPPDTVRLELPRAAALLAEAQSKAATAAAATETTVEAWKKSVEEFSARVVEAEGLLTKAGFDAGRLGVLKNELANPAQELARRDAQQLGDRNRTVGDLNRLSDQARRWTGEINETFDRSTQELASRESFKSAMEKLDGLPRSQRLQSLLLEGASEKLLDRLAKKHEVQLFTLESGQPKKFWEPTSRDSSLPAIFPKPVSETTDLAASLKSAPGGQDNAQRGAVVIFSDGQHNEGDSPLDAARVSAGRGVPVYTVGFGPSARPRDLAVVKTDAPEAVFFEDRVRGQITLKDDVPAGQAFHVAIKDGATTVWEQSLVTEGKNLRTVPFEFPMGELVKERLKGQREGVQLASLPLDLQVSVSTVEGDTQPANNQGSLRLRAVTQKRRILLLDGRPRWESRYLTNMFARDEQWEVNTVIPGSSANDLGWPRGDQPGTFPSDAALLAGYDLIIFGDVPKEVFKGDELIWIRDFVAQRGGAIIFIDGSRNRLRQYGETAAGALLPVEYKGEGLREGITRVSLTERSANLAAFVLAADSGQNAQTWSKLAAPRWVSAATPLIGADVLLNAEVNGQTVPVAVYRPFGAGKVFYHAFDDSWRWRYEVADQYHVRYWNQVANWIAELPFAVRDKFVSLDAGALTYRPGESAELRARLRDSKGKPVTDTAVDAILYREGIKVATIRLAPDENAGGLLRGRTNALEPGNYEVGVEAAAIPSGELRARTSFKVEPRPTGELVQLNANEDLLRQISELSGGAYLREEEIDRLADLLAPMSQGRIVESDTVLWQSYWWFLPIILLLTAEWILRKRFGLL